MSVLFEPAHVGRYQTQNRIFMAPMSRYRAFERGMVSDMTVEYYRQRASAGLIVAESTRINDWAGGVNCPGIFTQAQVAAWRKVTEAVHAQQGIIFLQLWHAGRATHTSLLPEGREVVAPSPLPNPELVMTQTGMMPPTPPRAMTLQEIDEVRQDFAAASRNALAAGFDGVEIHAAGGFLLDSFVQSCTNLRTDGYGGSLENRYRFLGEVMDDAVAIWGADRVGVKLSPTSTYNGVGEGDVLSTFHFVIERLNAYGLAFLEVNEELPFNPAPADERQILDDLQAKWLGFYIANGNYDLDSGAAQIAADKASAISFGRYFIANPDLPARFAAKAPLNDLDPDRFYGGDHKGYTDYPALVANCSLR